MASKRDYYEVLGVGRSASDQEISNAYRKLALRYHPDRNSDDDAVGKFKQAAEAFEVLSNPEKRTRYDRYGQAGLEGAGGGSPQFHDASDIFEAFGHVFGDLFGGGGGRRGGGGQRRVQRGAHVRCEVVLDLAEAAKDTTKTVSFRRAKSCSECNGSGAKPGTRPETCNYCGGHGRVVQSTGIFSMQTTCPTCEGQGTIVRNPCAVCRGAGVVSEKVSREVQIPAGVDNGSRLRLAGEGEPSPNGGPRGDCYCYIKVRDHELFQRDGRELICHVPITYSQAALGATIDVPTLDGCEQLEIAAGTQSGDVFRMSGRGMPEPGYRGRGALHVQVAIEVPKKLNDEHRRILRELAEVEEVDVSPQRETFFGKLKEYFQTD